jgi:AraC-like DNA-binding protein
VSNVLVDRMRQMIDLRYAEPLTLRTLSTEIGRQPAYLGRLFRQKVGTSVREYLTSVRLAHAAELIREGVKVEAVALKVGYRSKKNFYQRFQRQYGTTPVLCRTGPRNAAIGCSAMRQCCPVQQLPTLNMGVPAPADGVAPKSADASVTGSVDAIRTSTRAWQLAIQAQRAMLRRFNQLRVGLLLTDDRGRYVAANGAALAMTGYPADQLYELSPDKLFLAAPVRDTRCAWQFLLRRHSQTTRTPNATLRTMTGDEVAVHVVTVRNFLWGRREMSAMIDRVILPMNDPWSPA